MPLRARFGRCVRTLRQERILTQEILAERSELSVDAIRRIERGNMSPSLETLRKLAGGLNVSLHTLFQNFDDERPAQVAEICDFLTRRNEREVRLAWRVLHAMFEDRER
jgi:transcriptional regulator with XRE-family HTH domain